MDMDLDLLSTHSAFIICWKVTCKIKETEHKQYMKTIYVGRHNGCTKLKKFLCELVCKYNLLCIHRLIYTHIYIHQLIYTHVYTKTYIYTHIYIYKIKPYKYVSSTCIQNYINIDQWKI